MSSLDSPHSLQRRLQRIVGRSLTSVVFIHDYIQFIFDGPILTTLTLPRLDHAGIVVSQHCAGYCDGLCSQIGLTVSSACVTSEGVSIQFENQAELSVSLLPADYVGPEAINFDSDEGKVVA